MLATLVLAASSMAIPFGTGSDTPPTAPSSGPAQRYEMGFQFAEKPSGYQLNAVLFDKTSGTRSTTAIRPCTSIDIDSFTETDFGTPVICDGMTFMLDIQDGAIVAVPVDGGRGVEVKQLSPGRAYINGMPLLIRAGR